MTIAYLNGEFKPLEQAQISPMDRGFLFGDGIYEVVPSYAGKLVAGNLHAQRMNRGLSEIGIKVLAEESNWVAIAEGLLARNLDHLPDQNVGIYIHVSRGADTKRFHAFPEGVKPTVFAFAFSIAPSAVPDRTQAKGLHVQTQEDLRWRRCHIKSTSLLGNVMHFQDSFGKGINETVLYNQDGMVTEASVSNVFAVIDGEIVTPPLDNQLLPGITRHILINSIRKDGQYQLVERQITLEELKGADEVWLTSSSKEVAPVVMIDNQAVGNGVVGEVWEQVAKSYHTHKFSF
ncbi:aminotransferase class IV [Alteromonas sp. ASW11-36]|uniref:branched-chain-amino-acid transaminase n=1 Tax=Alteromonas arenosi TaxID=3055817 RepID=A0ABT7SZG3_9ALTE|nr:aminotransferase class IV [Alteromonas sp. ASW11-36]MDM7860924.1 aminotransferase class IV [Alteromonas sp. ASW11-36]